MQKRDKLGRFLPSPLVSKKVLILRTCAKNMKANYRDFTWPRSGPVECLDWLPTKECGHGLHGFLWGEGDGRLASWYADAMWLVVEVNEAEIIDIDGDKVKFPCGNVLYAGDRKTATDMIRAAAPDAAVIGSMILVGGKQSIRVGHASRVSAGDNCFISAKGDDCVITAGTNSDVNADCCSNITVGNNSKVCVTDDAIVSAGPNSKISVGHDSKVYTQHKCVIEAGEGSIVHAEADSVVSAGKDSTIVIEYGNFNFSQNKNCQRIAVGYVSRNAGDLKPDVKYKVDKAGKFVEVKKRKCK